MEIREIFTILLLIILILCAIAVNFTKNLLSAVVIFMAYSLIMAIVWAMMRSPDLAITEAAVGAGVSGTLFLVTLKKVHLEDKIVSDLIEIDLDESEEETAEVGEGAQV
ncbi:MAG: DUF4040 domain-containing protein [Lachnospiraceae bacterium]|nr:DUF4040 domain-containing protein [Lachnospiraceae bacterium]